MNVSMFHTFVLSQDHTPTMIRFRRE